MKSQPHSLISRYERMVLSPLTFVYYATALYFLWHRAWLLGIGIILLSFVIGAIAQGLPHRKHETVRELAERHQAFAGEHEGLISDQDSFAMSKALSLTSFLVAFTAFIVGHHLELRWYWLLLTVVCIVPLFAASAFLIAIGPGKLIGLFRSEAAVERPTRVP